MQKFNQLFLAFLTIAIFITCTSIAKQRPEGGWLWKISGNGLSHPSYLFGTYHGTYDILYQYTDSIPELHQAFNACSQFAAIIEKYNLWVVSDEIHCDLIRCGRRHIPMAKVMDRYPKLITCMAPTKTFNMAGLAFSNIIIRDPALRARFQERDKLFGMVNPMSLTAAQAAYSRGGAWHEALKQYLDENFAFVKAFLSQELPEAVMYIPEATYLAWVDLSRCLPDVADLPDFFANKAGVLLEGGDSLFVGNAKGYVRLNLAMPRAIIQTGLERMRDAIREEQAKH